MKNYLIYIGFCITVFISGTQLLAQQDSIDIKSLNREQVIALTNEELFNLPFEDLLYLANKLGITVDELLNMKVTVGTKTELTPRETPGIISVVMSDEIRKSGARDLLDVLKLVPGLAVGYDLDGALGLAMRGNWGYEGKILVLLDGQEMNEGMYSTANFGRHFPVENIERIEIIRGAGSAVYGGYAELGVVNIITKKPVNKLMVSESYGQMSSITGHSSTTLSTGFKKGETSLTLHGFYGTGNRSEKVITDFYGDEYDLGNGYSKYTEKNFNLGLNSKVVNIRFIYDDYQTNIIQYSEDAINRFQNFMGELDQTYEINKKLSLTPGMKVKSQLPYNLEEEDWFYRKRFYRINPSILLKYNAGEKLNVLGGIDYYSDVAFDKDEDEETVFYPDETGSISFYNFAAFVQALYKTKYLNFIAGGRVDYHNQAGAAFSPRAGITGISGALHYKLLYSQAFRSPSVENISLNPEIVPERTNMLELETGVRLSDNFFITTNFFDITLHDPIVYIYYPGTQENDYADESEAYENYSQSGTRGIEVEGKIVFHDFYANLGYSYYTASGKNEVGLYNALNSGGSINENALQGFAQNKFTLHTGYNLSKNIVFSVNAVWEGKKYGLLDSDSVQTLNKPTVLLDAFIEFRNIKGSGFSAGIGTHNIINQDIWYYQPYSNANSPYYPYPGAGREIMARVRYDMDWTR